MVVKHWCRQGVGRGMHWVAGTFFKTVDDATLDMHFIGGEGKG